MNREIRHLTNYSAIPDFIGIDPSLSSKAKLVWLNFACHRNSQTGACFPSDETQSKETGLSLKAISAGRKELIQKGLLIKSRIRLGDGTLGRYQWDLLYQKNTPKPPEQVNACAGEEKLKQKENKKPKEKQKTNNTNSDAPKSSRFEFSFPRSELITYGDVLVKIRARAEAISKPYEFGEWLFTRFISYKELGASLPEFRPERLDVILTPKGNLIKIIEEEWKKDAMLWIKLAKDELLRGTDVSVLANVCRRAGELANSKEVVHPVNFIRYLLKTDYADYRTKDIEV